MKRIKPMSIAANERLTPTAKIAAFGGILGFFATLMQIVFIREFWVLRGVNELYLGVILFHWLWLIGAGAATGRGLYKRPRVSMVTSIFLLCLTPLAALLVRHYESVLQLQPGEPLTLLPFALFSLANLFPAAFAVGFLFTVAAATFGKRQREAINIVYIGEGVGAMAAGVLFSFVLSHNMGSVPILLAACCAMLASLLAMLYQLPKRIWATVLLLGIGGVTVVHITRVDDFSLGVSFEQQTDRGSAVQCKDTHYSRVCIGEQNGQFQLYSNGEFEYVFPDPYTRPVPIHFALAQHPNPQSLLVIGGGASDRVAPAMEHGIQRIHYIERDEKAHNMVQEITQELSDHPSLKHDVQFHHGSPRNFLNFHLQSFNVIVQFASPATTAADHNLHTVQFFHAIKRALTQNGVFVLVTRGSANVFSAPQKRLLLNEYSTVNAVFTTVVPFVGIQTFLVASDAIHGGNHFAQNRENLEQRLAQRNPSLQYVCSNSDIWGAQKTRQREQLVKHSDLDDGAEISVDAKPNQFVHTVQLQQLARGAGITKNETSSAPFRSTPFNALSHWALYASVVGFGLFILVSFAGLARKSREKSTGVLSIATTGLCGVGAEIILIYLFSAQFGGLYHHIAGLLAGFMLGLALGAALGYRLRLAARAPFFSDLAVLLVLGCIGGLVSSTTVPATVSIWGFGLLIVLSGGATGFAFPIFLQVMGAGTERETEGQNIRIAAQMEIADHIGAAAGAICTAVVWLPHLGVTWTCVLLLCFKVPLIIKNARIFV